MKSIKRLCLAAVLALAFAAFPAVASAGVWADDYPADLSGENGDWNLIPGAEMPASTCTGSSFEASLSDNAYELTTSSLTGCTGGDLETNGCEIKMHPGSGTFDILPSGCGPIEVQSHLFCEYTIPSQTGLAANYSNFGSGSNSGFTFEMDASDVDYTIENPIGCGTQGSHSDGFLYGSWNVTAEHDSQPTGVHAGDWPIDLWAGSSSLNAGLYPVDIVGELDPSGSSLAFTTSDGGLDIYCDTVQADAGSFESYTSELTFDTTFEGCGIWEPGDDSEVQVYFTGTCSGLELAASGSYDWGTSLDCEEGQGYLVILLDPYCAYLVEDQEFDNSSKLTTNGTSPNTVNASLETDGLSYIEIGDYCFLSPGDGTDAQMDLDITLSGSDG